MCTFVSWVLTCALWGDIKDFFKYEHDFCPQVVRQEFLHSVNINVPRLYARLWKAKDKHGMISALNKLGVTEETRDNKEKLLQSRVQIHVNEHKNFPPKHVLQWCTRNDELYLPSEEVLHSSLLHCPLSRFLGPGLQLGCLGDGTTGLSSISTTLWSFFLQSAASCIPNPHPQVFFSLPHSAHSLIISDFYSILSTLSLTPFSPPSSFSNTRPAILRNSPSFSLVSWLHSFSSHSFPSHSYLWIIRYLWPLLLNSFVQNPS